MVQEKAKMRYLRSSRVVPRKSQVKISKQCDMHQKIQEFQKLYIWLLPHISSYLQNSHQPNLHKEVYIIYVINRHKLFHSWFLTQTHDEFTSVWSTSTHARTWQFISKQEIKKREKKIKRKKITSVRITWRVSLTGISLHIIPLWILCNKISSDTFLRRCSSPLLSKGIKKESPLYRSPSTSASSGNKNSWEYWLLAPQMVINCLRDLLKKPKQLQQPISVNLENEKNFLLTIRTSTMTLKETHTREK